MKLRITVEDIKQLNEDQKRKLTELWRPQKYDVALASMIMDVENEVFDEFEFVVGNVSVDKRANIYIHDITGIPANASESDNEEEASLGEDTEKSSDDNEVETYDEEFEEEEESEDDFDITYTRPIFFSKEDCVPLLNIGQLMELLQRFNFGSADFYLNAGTGETGCEIGRIPATWVDYSGDQDPDELCDVLWEIVKLVLG
jgi:hypothetical protein